MSQEIFSTWKTQIEMSPSSIFSKQDVMSIIDSISKALSLVEGEVLESKENSYNIIASEAIDNFKKEILKNLAKLEDEGKYHDELMNFSQIVYNIEPGNVLTVKDGVLLDSKLFEAFLNNIKDNSFQLEAEEKNNNEIG